MSADRTEIPQTKLRLLADEPDAIRPKMYARRKRIGRTIISLPLFVANAERKAIEAYCSWNRYQ